MESFMLKCYRTFKEENRALFPLQLFRFNLRNAGKAFGLSCLLVSFYLPVPCRLWET